MLTCASDDAVMRGAARLVLHSGACNFFAACLPSTQGPRSAELNQNHDSVETCAAIPLAQRHRSC